MLLNPKATFPLAIRFREQGASIGEVYSFISGLYFRGKLAYANCFAPGATLVIAAGRGLLPPETIITPDCLRSIAAIDVSAAESRFADPLIRDARTLGCAQAILLGSIATPKYTNPLLEVFGDQLLFLQEFVGRGDMSRGGLLLRCVESRSELAYIPARGSVLRGARPPKLPKKSLNRSMSSTGGTPDVTRCVE